MRSAVGSTASPVGSSTPSAASRRRALRKRGFEHDILDQETAHDLMESAFQAGAQLARTGSTDSSPREPVRSHREEEGVPVLAPAPAPPLTLRQQSSLALDADSVAGSSRRESRRESRRDSGRESQREEGLYNPPPGDVLPSLEMQLSQRASRWLVHPRSRNKSVWDLCLSVLILVSVITIPFRLAFMPDEENAELLAVDIVVDVIFFADMVLSFNTMYYDEGDVLIKDRGSIAKRYLRGWFTVDLLSTLPFDRLLPLLLEDFAGLALRSLKLIRVLRLARLLKLVRLLRLSRFLGTLQATLHINSGVLKLAKLLLTTTLLAHLLACFWFMVGDTGVEGGSWVMDAEVQDEGPGTQYVAALYWTVATMSAVGYGDITAQSTEERLFSIVTQLTGAALFGFIIGNIANLLESLDRRAAMYKQKMAQVKNYMVARDLPKPLMIKIRKYYEYYFSRKSIFDEGAILANLSTSLRDQVLMQTNKDTVMKIQLFEAEDSSFVGAIIACLKPLLAPEDDVVAKENTLGTEMYLLVEGIVDRFVTRNEEDFVVSVMTEKTYFGEVSLLSNTPRLTGMRAATHSELFVLSKEDLHEILIDFPEADENMRKTADKRKRAITVVLENFEAQGWVKSAVRGGAGGVAADAEGQPPPSGRRRSVTEMFTDNAFSPTAARKSTASVAPLPDGLEAAGAADAGGGALVVVNDELMVMATACAKLGRTASLAHIPRVPRASVDLTAMGGLAGLEAAAPRSPGSQGESSLSSRSFSALTSKPASVGGWLCRLVPKEVWIAPYSPFKVRWDLLLLIFILYSVVSIPYRIGFSTEAVGAWFVLDVVVDCFFMVDICVNFCTGIEVHEILVMDTRQVASAYLRGWFVIDFVSSVPLDQIIGAALGGGGSGLALRSFRLIRVLRLIRLVKLLRLLKLGRFLDSFEDVANVSPAVVKMGRLLMQVTFVAHIMSCFWFFVSNAAGYEDARWWDCHVEGAACDMGDEDNFTLYIASLYWAFTTMTTVGYGDVAPVHLNERLYSVFAMLVGGTVFGFIVGSVAALGGQLDFGATAYRRKMDNLTDYCRERKLTPELQHRLIKHYEVYLNRKSAMDEETILAELPDRLRNMVVLHVNRDIIHKIPFFRQLSDELVAYVFEVMRPEYCGADDYVFMEGQIGRHMYFCLKGRLQVLQGAESGRREDEIIFKELGEGDYFGEIALLLPLKRTASIRAVLPSHLFALCRADINRLTEHYPHLGQQMQTLIKQRLAANKVILAKTGAAASPSGSKVAVSAHPAAAGGAGEEGEEAKAGLPALQPPPGRRLSAAVLNCEAPLQDSTGLVLAADKLEEAIEAHEVRRRSSVIARRASLSPFKS